MDGNKYLGETLHKYYKEVLLNVTKWNKIQTLMDFPKIKNKDDEY